MSLRLPLDYGDHHSEGDRHSGWPRDDVLVPRRRSGEVQELTFMKRGLVEWREASEPRLQGPGDVLVRPLAVATCDLDAAIIRGRAPFVGPFPLGHEFVAEVT